MSEPDFLFAGKLPEEWGVEYSLSVITCPKCSEPNPPKAKFCMECGAPLVCEAAPIADEIRFLTMLFADIKGFTAMSSRLSPDQLKEILESCFSRLTRVMQSQNGHLVKFEGDCIVAAFGLENSSGMDPIHACLAALDMKRELDHFNSALEKERGFRVEMRIGLHCGQVVVGLLGGRLDILGDAVNMTARMEQNAPSGEILITHDLALQLRDRFLLSPVSSLKVKGKDEPLNVHLLKGETPFLRRKILDRKTRFIGRDPELATMLQFFDECRNSGKAAILLFQSAPGCGKSRLLAEFEAAISEKVRPLVFMSCVFSPNLTMNIQILRSFLHVNRGISTCDDLLEHLKQLFPDEYVGTLSLLSSHLASLLGLRQRDADAILVIKENPEEVWQKALSGLSDIFTRLVTKSPVLVLLDDIHWIDEGSLRVLKSLVESVKGPFCVVAMGRPEKTGLEEVVRLPGARVHNLEPLTPEKSLELVNELLSSLPDVPSHLVDQVTTIAHGNPFFIEEVIINLRDREVICGSENTWSIDTERLKDLAIPANIEMIVQARLDLLPRPDLELLKKASVMGRAFFWEPVARREGGHLPAEGLANFLNRGLILVGNDDPELGYRQYRFSHEIIREVLYSRLTHRQKQTNHLVMAEWFRSLKAGEEILLRYICYHFEHAGRFQEAAEAAIQAGCLALRKYQTLEAGNYFSQAERLLLDHHLQLDPKSLLEFLEGYAETLILEDKPALVIDFLDRHNDSLEEHSIADLRVRLKRLEALEKMGHDQPWQKLLLETENLLKKVSSANRVERKRLIAGFAFRQGEYFRLHRSFLEARECLQKALDIAEELHDKWSSAFCHKSLGVISFQLEDRAEALEHYRLALIALEELNNRESVQVYLDNAARAYRIKLDLDQSVKEIEQALADFRKTADKGNQARCLNYLAVLCRYKQDYEKSLTLSKEALAIREELGDGYGQILCVGNMGIVYRGLGQFAESQKMFERALTMSEATDDPQGISYFLIALSTVFRIRRQFDPAIHFLRKAYELRRTLGDDGLLLPLEEEIRRCILERDISRGGP